MKEATNIKLKYVFQSEVLLAAAAISPLIGAGIGGALGATAFGVGAIPGVLAGGFFGLIASCAIFCLYAAWKLILKSLYETIKIRFPVFFQKSYLKEQKEIKKRMRLDKKHTRKRKKKLNKKKKRSRIKFMNKLHNNREEEKRRIKTKLNNCYNICRAVIEKANEKDIDNKVDVTEQIIKDFEKDKLLAKKSCNREIKLLEKKYLKYKSTKDTAREDILFWRQAKKSIGIKFKEYKQQLIDFSDTCACEKIEELFEESDRRIRLLNIYTG